MKVILVDERHGNTSTIVLRGWLKGFLSLCLLGAPVALGYLGFQLAYSQNLWYSQEVVKNWDQQLDRQSATIAEVRRRAEEQIEALTVHLAMLQAGMLRLDAVGQRVTTLAGVDTGEFDFSSPPPVGGPFTEDSAAYRSPDFIQAINELEAQIADRQQQLQILEGLMVDEQRQDNVAVAGRPVSSGWISSNYGQRPDPFTGRPAWHQGMDFATGRAGDDIHAVAAGLVTWSGERSGYGNMVEVNHGNGYVTRYGHAQDLLVDIGDIVRKGDTIALIGSTGRSTGPHVHFEVYKNGRVVDPASYVRRTVR